VAPDGGPLSATATRTRAGTVPAQLPYDPEKDSEPVGTLMQDPRMLVVK
jgi:tripartite-type tricarboxylate transporter receptor subunit TctC